MIKSGKVYILILNWNSWQDTIECIESVLKSNYKDFQIVIIDNDSSDNSVDYIIKYLNYELCPMIDRYKDKILPFHVNKIPYIIYSEEEAVDGGSFKKECRLPLSTEVAYPVVIIKNQENYGFAKGINIAFKFILKRNDFEYVWLLNNDSIVEYNTLTELIKEAKSDYKVGFVGSVIRFYDKPELIQAVGGGRFYSLFGLGRLYMKNQHVSILRYLKREDVNKHIDYIMGASLLIKRQVLKDIGLFDENYFLYAEELDLITRGRKKGWKLSVALNSYVYHKESASTKSKKWLYYYLLTKNNMIYLKKHYGTLRTLFAVPFVVLNAFRVTRDLQNIKAVLKGVMDGVKYGS